MKSLVTLTGVTLFILAFFGLALLASGRVILLPLFLIAVFMLTFFGKLFKNRIRQREN